MGEVSVPLSVIDAGGDAATLIVHAERRCAVDARRLLVDTFGPLRPSKGKADTNAVMVVVHRKKCLDFGNGGGNEDDSERSLSMRW